MDSRIFVIGIDMENRSADDIAREAAFKINSIFDKLVEEQNKEKEAQKNDSNTVWVTRISTPQPTSTPRFTRKSRKKH